MLAAKHSEEGGEEMLTNVVQLQKKTTDDLRVIDPVHLNHLKRQATFICGHLPADPADALVILQIATVTVARLDTLELGALGAMFQAVKSQLSNVV